MNKALIIKRMIGKLLKRLEKFTISKNDVLERVSSGSGPGGQKVNKSENCVNLIHVPTGIWVKVHDSRDLLINRHMAWKRLEAKVEFHMNGEDSKIGRRIEKIRKKKSKARRRSFSKQEEQKEDDEKAKEESETLESSPDEK